jgi:fatty acid amide hydrolase 2
VSNVSVDVLEGQKRVIEFIESYTNQKVKQIESKYLRYAFFMWFSMASKNTGKSQVAKMMTNDKYTKNVWVELMKSIFKMSEHTAPVVVLSCLEKVPLSEKEMEEYLVLLELLKEEFDSILKNNGILIYPSFPTVAPFHNQALWTNTIDHLYYFGIFNALGFPCTQIPIGLNSKDNLPIGIQLVSNRYCDYLTINLASLIENKLGGWIES